MLRCAAPFKYFCITNLLQTFRGAAADTGGLKVSPFQKVKPLFGVQKVKPLIGVQKLKPFNRIIKPAPARSTYNRKIIWFLSDSFD